LHFVRWVIALARVLGRRLVALRALSVEVDVSIGARIVADLTLSPTDNARNAINRQPVRRKIILA